MRKARSQAGSLCCPRRPKNDDGKVATMDVELGMHVLYAKYAGTEIKIDGRKLLIMKEADILAIVE